MGSDGVVIMRFLLWLVLVACALGMLLGLLMVTVDSLSHYATFVGIGVVIGLRLMAVVTVFTVPCVVSLLLWRRRRTASMVVATMLGVLVVCVSIPLASSSSLWAWTWLPVTIGLGLVATSVPVGRTER